MDAVARTVSGRWCGKENRWNTERLTAWSFSCFLMERDVHTQENTRITCHHVQSAILMNMAIYVFQMCVDIIMSIQKGEPMEDVKIRVIDSDKLVNAINEGSYDVNLSSVMALGAVMLDTKKLSPAPPEERTDKRTETRACD